MHNDEVRPASNPLARHSPDGPQPLGEEAVRRELKVIRDVGYVRAYRVKGDAGRMAGMRYEISKRQMPLQQQIGVVSELKTKPQVSPSASNERTWTLPGMPKSENRRSADVPPRATHGDPPYMVDQAKPQVAPCASNHGAPPTPPSVTFGTAPALGVGMTIKLSLAPAASPQGVAR